MTVAENYILDTYHREPYSTRGIARPRGDRRARRRAAVKDFDIRTPSIDDLRRARCPAATSRRSSSPASSRGPVKLVIAAQPTRGLDVGSIEYIHRRIVEQRDAGRGHPDRQHRARRGARRRRPDRGHVRGARSSGSLEGDEATYEKVGHADGRRPSERASRTAPSGPAVVPILAIVTAFLVGSIVHPDHGLRATCRSSARTRSARSAARSATIVNAYGAMVVGAFGDPGQDRRRASRTADAKDIATAIRPITETLVAATPLIFTGLAVAISFRSGVFNIGVEGQFILGAFGATVAAIALKGQPAVADPDRRRSPRASLTGAFWGFIPGFLKARPAPTRSSRPSCSTTSPPRSSCSACARTSCARRAARPADLEGAVRLRAHPAASSTCRPSGCTTASSSPC